METQIENVIKKVDDGFLDNKEQHKAIGEIITTIDERKADLSIVNAIRADLSKIVWIILTGVVVAVLALILKP